MTDYEAQVCLAFLAGAMLGPVLLALVCEAVPRLVRWWRRG